MKKIGVLFVFLIGISGEVALGLEEYASYEDPYTGLWVARNTQNFEGGHHLVCGKIVNEGEDDDGVKAEFNLELSQKGVVLIKDYEEKNWEDDSLLTVLRYLEKEGFTVSGHSSNVFLSDTMNNKKIRATLGFKPANEVLAKIPTSLASVVDTLYVRRTQISVILANSQSDTL